MVSIEKYGFVVSSEYEDANFNELSRDAIFSGLTEKTSSHGIPQIQVARGSVKKIMWACASVVALALLLWYMSNIFLLFFSWPVDVKVEMLARRELEFPAVTICNMNLIKKSALQASASLQSAFKERRRRRSVDENVPPLIPKSQLSGWQPTKSALLLLTKSNSTHHRHKRSITLSSCNISSAGYDSQTGICYGLFDSSTRDFDSAIEQCNDEGSIAVINSQANLDFIESRTAEICGGISDVSIQGYWIYNKNLKWINELETTWSNWKPGEPSSTEDCAIGRLSTLNKHQWEAVSCSNSDTYLALCQKYIGCPNPLYIDNNGMTFCYFLFGSDAATEVLFNARKACRKLQPGASVAELDSEAKVNHIKSLNLFDGLTGYTHYWINLKTFSSIWKWRSDDREMTWSNWESGQGLGKGYNTRAGANITTHKWYSFTGNSPSKQLVVCEIRGLITSTSVTTSTEPLTTTEEATTLHEEPTTSIEEHSTMEERTTTTDPISSENPTTDSPITSNHHSSPLESLTTTVTFTTQSKTLKSTVPQITPAPVPVLPTVPPLVGSKFPERVQYRQNFQQQEQITETVANLPDEEKASLGYKANEFILDCQYFGYPCDPEKDFASFYNAIHGNCFIFNSKWSNFNKTFKSYKTGRRYGLKVTVNIGQDDYTDILGESAGVRFVVHPQHKMPFPEDEGYLAKPGKLTSVGLKKVVIERKGGWFGTCVDTNGENYTRNVYEEVYDKVIDYSMMSCYKTCYQRSVIDTCGCADSYYPKYGAAFDYRDVRTCDTSNIDEDDCKYGVNLKYINNELECNCPIPCMDEVYIPSISTSRWPSDVQKNVTLMRLGDSISHLMNDPNDTTKFERNVLLLEVYFEEFNYERIFERQKYRDASFISDIGGILGLFLGFTIMTVIEFLEFITDYIVLAILWVKHRDIWRTYNNTGSRENIITSSDDGSKQTIDNTHHKDCPDTSEINQSALPTLQSRHRTFFKNAFTNKKKYTVAEIQRTNSVSASVHGSEIYVEDLDDVSVYEELNEGSIEYKEKRGIFDSQKANDIPQFCIMPFDRKNSLEFV